MAEPTCLMPPFSNATTPTPPFPNETHQETNSATHGLGESISFGSYVYEDLEWEKWSSFNEHNRNRYVAEAEKYSKPGSVAQKKAYFEAHYKKKTAPRAAALLEREQNDAAQANDTFRDEANNVTTYDHGKELKSSSNLPTETNGFHCVKTESESTGDLVVNHKSKKVNSSLPPPPPPPPSHRRSYQNYSDYDMNNEVNHDVDNEESSSEVTQQIEKPVLQEESIEVAVEVKKKIIPLSFYLSSPEVEVAPPAGISALIHHGKEIAATSSKTFTPENPAKASLDKNRSQPQLMDPDLTKYTSATTSSNTGRRKFSLSIILKSCCLRNEETTSRRKQEKAESEPNKFR